MMRSGSGAWDTASIRSRKRSRLAAVGIALAGIVLAPLPAQARETWTLERSVQRVLEIAPEAGIARDEVAAREGAHRQAGSWPNPDVELRADDKIGKDEGDGGSDLTQFVLSQPLPLGGRLGYGREIAESMLQQARAGQRYQRLLLEAETARRFHALQLTAANLRLAEQRLQLADELQRIGQRRQQAGELAGLERLRLDLIRATAQQSLDTAEGEYGEALSQFRTYLGLAGETAPEPEPLQPFGAVPALETLQASLAAHPALAVENHRADAARAEIGLARAERLPDPVLRLFRERDFLDGRRQDITGIGIAVTLPVWDRNAGRIGEAHARVDQAMSGIRLLERDLGSRLRQSHLHLSHLVAQGEHFRARLFDPARTVLDLTRKAYAAGEVEILALIDANNTYFDAHSRYLELLKEAWLEAAELRLAAGRPLVTLEQEIQP